MVVCVCNAISENEIRDWASLGGESIEQLQADLGLGTCCGRCRDHACEMLSVELVRPAGLASAT